MIASVAPPKYLWQLRLARSGLIAAVCVGFVGCASVGGSNAGPGPTSSTRFEAAKQAWEKGATVDSADQGTYWSRAASDLTQETGSGESGDAGFRAAEHELQQLNGLPHADQTHAERAEFHHDTQALNSLFGTTALYG
jgi:hypothetical protein